MLYSGVLLRLCALLLFSVHTSFARILTANESWDIDIQVTSSEFACCSSALPCTKDELCTKDTFITGVNAILQHHVITACKLPETFIIFTHANEYHMSMVTMQFFSLFTVPLSFADSAACLAPRYMVVCLDNGCIKVCIKEGFSFCVRGYLGSYAHSDFKANDFQRINADKWQLAKDVSSRSSFFIMVDADVLIFLNPLAKYGADLGAYDFRYQVESGDGCNAGLNSGVMLFHESPGAAAFLDTMVAKSGEIKSQTAHLDQDYAAELLGLMRSNGTIRACAFPKACVSGHCGVAHADNTLSEVCTYHAHCLTGKSKVEHMSHILRVQEDAVRGDASRTLRWSQFDLNR